jgi:imidazolonepropionase-like amidohydrolase
MTFRAALAYAMTKSRLGAAVLLVAVASGCSAPAVDWDNINEDGAFLVFRRQSLIGEESYNISSSEGAIVVTSLQGENERGRITGVQAELRLEADLSPTYYRNRRLSDSDTTNVLEVTVTADQVTIREKDLDVVTTSTPSSFFPVHSNIPAAVEMMLYHYYLERGAEALPTLPRGEISLTHRGRDVVEIAGEPTPLDRYIVEGINWGFRTIWLDEWRNLVALVQANTQFREMVRKGYEEALPFFVAGNVEEQMSTLSDYTADLQEERATITALVGGDLVDGLSDITRSAMTVLIADGRISEIGPADEIVVPEGARVIDVTGKTLLPGLWDMHAHSNQVQWAPAYLAGGITTIRDLGNELEFATAFRDAIALNGAMGPDILLGGMVDGAGITGNGVIRATNAEEARAVVALYYEHGYKQVKIYTAIEPDVLKVLTEEAHQRGMTVSGHVPRAVGNTIAAVESGMDQLNHRGLFLSIVFPDMDPSKLGGLYLAENEVSPRQVEAAIDFLLEHETVLDPTISLDLIRNLPWGTPVETVEPDVTQIAYELWEGKRFLAGVSPERAALMQEDVRKAMEIIGDFYRAGVPIVAGTDNVVPVYSLYREMEAYHELGGLSPFDVIRTATIIPARAMGLDAETGTLEVGKEADLAILDENPLLDIGNIRSVSAVMTNGYYYESTPLWRAADFETGGSR